MLLLTESLLEADRPASRPWLPDGFAPRSRVLDTGVPGCGVGFGGGRRDSTRPARRESHELEAGAATDSRLHMDPADAGLLVT